jgi:hypothetical protein
MEYKNKDFSLEIIPEQALATLKGVMRLPSPAMYSEGFELLAQAIFASKVTFVLRIADVPFMNSSGVTALSRVILDLKKKSVPLKILGQKGVTWQEKTLSSLCKLHPGIQVEFL